MIVNFLFLEALSLKSRVLKLLPGKSRTYQVTGIYAKSHSDFTSLNPLRLKTL